MAWQFDNSIPIYIQLVETLKIKIISGEIPPGDKLSSVRELAETAGVNPNTMQRALSELESLGLIYSVRTSGRYVTDDVDLILNLKNEIAAAKIKSLFDSLLKLGFSDSEIVSNLKKQISIS